LQRLAAQAILAAMRIRHPTATSSTGAALVLALSLVVLALLLAGPSALADSAPPPLAVNPRASAQAGATDNGPPSPAHACAGLCNAFYKAAPDDRALCLEGCQSAAKCTERCNQRHQNPEDRERCHYRCARSR